MGKASRSREARRAKEAAERTRTEGALNQAEEEGWPTERLTAGVGGNALCTVILPADEENPVPMELEGVLVTWTTPNPPGAPTIIAEVRLAKPIAPSE